MANDTYYAWGPILLGEKASKDEPGQTQTIKPGETVDPAALDLDKAAWDQLRESGAVRQMPYPNVPDTWQGSPVDYLRKQANMAAEGALTGAEQSEENMQLIQLANAASTGTAMLPGVEKSTGPSEEATPPAETQKQGGNGS